MDTKNDKEYIFNLKLTKIIGLYQILNPNTKRVFGYNVYHLIIWLFGLHMAGLSSFFPMAVYYLTKDPTALTFNIGCIENLMFANCKMLVILYYSKDIWKWMEVTGFRFIRYEKYNRQIFKNWKILSLRISTVYIIMSLLVLVVWISCPIVLSTSKITIKNIDGSYSNYRINVLNVYILLSDEVYNNYFTIFYAVEIIVLGTYVYFMMLFDILMLITCCALTCHLRSVSNAISSLGHKGSIDNKSRNDLIELNTKNTKQDILFHDLNIIITDHQNVIEKMNEYLNIFRTIMLAQIFTASNSQIIIWFIAALDFSKVYNGESLSSLSLSVKLFILLPVFTIQLFMTCYLFGSINEKKDSIILALYSSNWIDMDIRNKRLILLTMKTNNANQLKMKFTYTKIVNLEMYSNTMRLCYSIFSMLIKYNQNKITSD